MNKYLTSYLEKKLGRKDFINASYKKPPVSQVVIEKIDKLLSIKLPI